MPHLQCALARLCESHRHIFVQELRARRSWRPEDHPQRLVFEVENQLQIRPQQTIVAQGIIDRCAAGDGPGPIVQLNMGEGKTRVILPMLVLHWARGDTVVRLNVLSPLMHEALGYMHRRLCASVLNRRLFVLPFRRDVALSAAQARAMRACLEHCRRAGGVLFVAPEHRLSLQLKWYELYLAGARAVCAALGDVQALPYRDMLDESDEILRHRQQLIYAVGAHAQLPSGPSRWSGVQALLAILNTDEEVAAVLERRGVACARGTRRRHPEAFDGVRLLPGDALEAVQAQLLDLIAEALIREPPHELRWLRGLKADPERRRAVVRFVTRTAAQPPDAGFAGDQWEDLLALRGLLAHGVLAHYLSRRHRVDYGAMRPGARALRRPVPRQRHPGAGRRVRAPGRHPRVHGPGVLLRRPGPRRGARGAAGAAGPRAQRAARGLRGVVRREPARDAARGPVRRGRCGEARPDERRADGPAGGALESGPGNTFSAQNRKKNQKIHDFRPKKRGGHFFRHFTV